MRPAGGDAGAPDPIAVRPRRASVLRVTPIGLFAAAFLLLLAGAFAVILAQTRASEVAPWISLGFSAGAVVFTGAALVLSRRR